MLGRAGDIKIEVITDVTKFNKWAKENANAEVLQLETNTPDGSVTIVYK